MAFFIIVSLLVAELWPLGECFRQSKGSEGIYTLYSPLDLSLLTCFYSPVLGVKLLFEGD